jgi:hypothetical protein
MITRTPLIAGNLPIKTLVARRWPTKTYAHATILNIKAAAIDLNSISHADSKGNMLNQHSSKLPNCSS